MTRPRSLFAPLFLAAAVWSWLGPLGAEAEAADGSIEGTIKVWRTRVTTEGATSGKDVVVYLEKVGKNDFPPPKEQPHLDQKGLEFRPHVLTITKGTTVKFLNSDNDRHNVYFLFEKSGKELDLGTWKPGETRTHTFEQADVAVTLCKLHLEMEGYIVVLANPYFTAAEIDGETQQATYSLKGVPPGQYTLRAWHKKLRLKDGSVSVTVEAGKTTTADLTITKKKYAK